MSIDSFTILGKEIKRGESAVIEFEIAKLHTRTSIKIPIIINRSKIDGPVILFMAGVHGDETNGVAIVREIIKKNYHIPNRGTIMCIPVLNIFGYLNQTREFPDGKDLNRVFPGSKNGSLASQFAYSFKNSIAPLADYIIDFHTGGGDKDNAPQIRCNFSDEKSFNLAKVFNAPFTVNSGLISKSVRETLSAMNKTNLLFEGGKSSEIDDYIVQNGVKGAVRVLKHLGIINKKYTKPKVESVVIKNTSWLRAPYSGMFKSLIPVGSHIEKNTIIGLIFDPFGEFEQPIKAPHKCYIFCINQAPVVNKGNAIFHISREAL